MTSDVAVVIVAGGRGTRLGGSVPKQFLPLAGEPVLVHTVRRFAGTPGLAQLVVVAAPAEFPRCEALLAPLALPLRLAAAGRERQDSVAAGLAAVEPPCTVVVVHDAVRPFVETAEVAACLAAARATGAALLATPVPDTVKRARDGLVEATVDRAPLWLAQTPQAFRIEILRRAHDAARRDGVAATDDAALVERLGLPVAIVPGGAQNRKLTTADDLAWAEAVLAGARRG
jgi:2-C-methyl-D-erythritol 4-phosphate cytidylyltransferase